MEIISLFNNGFLPGNHLFERSQAFTNFGEWKFAMNEKMKQFFEKAIPEIRKYFKGKITYAAGEWEQVKVEIHRIIADGDSVVVEMTGRNATTTEKSYINNYCWVCRVKDGKLYEINEYMDTELVTKAFNN